MKPLLIIIGLFTCVTQHSSINYLESCWKGRNTVKELLNEEGVIKREPNQGAIVLSSSRQLFPCNLPDSYQWSDSVLFSAEQKEIFPNERWEGHPIEITHIELKN